VAITKFLAFDARATPDNSEFLGASWCDGDEAVHSTSYSDARDAMAFYAGARYKLVAHGAESACMIMFLARRETFTAHYINEKWSYGKWYPTPTGKGAQIWCSFKLSGGLSIQELATSRGIAMYPAPSILRHPRIDPDTLPCFDHKTVNCPRCFGNVNKWAWVCEKHKQGECLECWQTQGVRVIHAHMAEYADFMGIYGLAPQRSVSTAAVLLWRKIDAPDPIWLRDKKADKLARAGYLGPRVEPFKLGKLTDVHYADVHMMYPYIMASVPMPDPAATEYNGSESLDDRWIEYEGVSHATVYQPQTHLPVLGVRAHGQIVYPVGVLRGVWPHCELRAARARGATITRVHETVYSTTCMGGATGFVAGFTNYREELKRAGDARELWVKLILNSLYGRWGLRREQVSLAMLPLPPGTTDRDWPEYEIYITRNMVLMRREQYRYIRDKWANPLWAATVTGYARIKLLEHMEAQGVNLAYVDTDSIISTEPINGLGEGVGALEDKGHYADALILAPKLYSLTGGTMDDKHAAAGVPRGQAARYIMDKRARWQHITGAYEAWDKRMYPGELQVIDELRTYRTTKRHVLNPAALLNEDGYTDTLPLTFGLGEQHDA
jgi:DNA polymerase type B, organellar and viral